MPLEFICVNCGEKISAGELLGTINNPYCETCWNEQWKGNEEKYILTISQGLQAICEDKPKYEENKNIIKQESCEVLVPIPS